MLQRCLISNVRSLRLPQSSENSKKLTNTPHMILRSHLSVAVKLSVKRLHKFHEPIKGMKCDIAYPGMVIKDWP